MKKKKKNWRATRLQSALRVHFFGRYVPVLHYDYLRILLPAAVHLTNITMYVLFYAFSFKLTHSIVKYHTSSIFIYVCPLMTPACLLNPPNAFSLFNGSLTFNFTRLLYCVHRNYLPLKCAFALRLHYASSQSALRSTGNSSIQIAPVWKGIIR